MSPIQDAFGRMFSSDGFVPRRICGLWPDWLVWEHVAGNALIWLAYMTVPLMIWRIEIRRSEWSPFRGILRAFALFIGLCGLGHFLDMLAFFHPMYRISGHVLLLTGLVSCWTVWSIRRAWPAFLALKSPVELERVIAERTEELLLANKVVLEGEARFRQLAESIPQLAWSARADGHIFWYNQRWYQYTGTTPEQMEGWGWRSVHDPQVLPEVLDRWNSSIAGGKPFEMVFPLRGADGRFRRFLTRIVPSHDDDGRVLHWFGTNTDIDDQKRAEERLQRSEEQLRSLNEDLEHRVRERTAELRQRVRLIDQAHDAILVLSRDGLIRSWNQGAERIYGWTEQEALGRIARDLLKTQFPSSLNQIERELDEIGSWNGELVHRRRDGILIVVASRWVLDREGSVDGSILEINSDITERKASEEALRKSESALKESQRLAGVGSWEWDPFEDVVLWSDELYRIFQLDPTRPAPNVARQSTMFTPESWSHLEAVLKRAVSDGLPYEVEAEVLCGDGLKRWLLSRGEAVRGPDGRVKRLRGAAQDVTSRKRFQEELQLTRDQAMAATRAKSEFLANMSHEIRTPMNGVLGMTELLLDTLLNDQQRRYAETIQGSGETLLTVINDILDFSKIEAGKLTLETTDFNLRMLVEDVVEILSPRARQKGLEILGRVDPEVPPRLVGDPVRIRQVLTNLAGNAIKFTAIGKVSLEAQLLAQDGETATYRILVRDTGIGIPESRQADIFESFTQVAGENGQRYGGTGLGLAISRNLVELMHGRIGVESRSGSGSTFWFEVPLEQAPAQSESPSSGLHSLSDHGRPEVRCPRPLRILLAEDNEVNRRVAIGMARRLGHEVDAVCNGLEAIEALDQDRHDIVLMDVQMPEMDGLSATAEIRRRERERGAGRHIPIIAMTAYAMQGDRERCLEAGMDGYISKPIHAGLLEEALLVWGAREQPNPAESRPEQPLAESRSFSLDTLGESCGDDPKLIQEILKVMVEVVPGSLGRLGTAVELEDARQIAWEAHSLRGVFATVGADAMASVCSTLDSLAQARDLGQARGLFESLSDRWDELEDETVHYLDILDLSLAEETG